jgi:hypothetical protein
VLRRNTWWTRLTKKGFNSDQDMIAEFYPGVQLDTLAELRFTLPEA